LGWIIFIVLLIIVDFFYQRTKRENSKKSKTIAFRNQSFDRDRARLQISEPSNFQHVQSGFVSAPTNFRHVTHLPASSASAGMTPSLDEPDEYTGKSGISGPSHFRHIAHGFDENTLKSAQLPVSAKPLRTRIKEQAISSKDIELMFA
jgi:hypothetical protein